MFELLYDLANEMNNNLFKESDTRSFPVDVTLENDSYHVYAAIPGFNKNEIEVDFLDNVLTISAKKEKEETKNNKYIIKERGDDYEYMRMLSFEEFELESIKAKYENGILEVILNPKKPIAKEKKTIVIE